MYYRNEDIEKLLDELKIEEVVGEIVDLKKSGSNYKGLCPFHADTNPSFMVNPAKNICKCFVCGTGGNPLTFYSKYKKISFGEAVKELAKKYRVNIKEQISTKNIEKIKENEKYYKIMEEAHNFYIDKIFSLEARIALDYLSERDLDTKTIKEYQLGYAPAKWSELSDYLIEKGYNVDDILNLGLIKKSENGNLYDTFRNRIIFPIYSTHGEVVAFGGRTLEKNSEIPKYINSSDTPIFKKGKNLYGIDRGRNIREKKYSILMEGYMDVLTACTFGFDTSLAPLGTALTEEQADLIKRYSPNIILSFDMDKAGISATERAAFILKNKDFNIRVLEFTEAKDPDEFLRKKGKNKFLEVVKNSIEIFDFLYKIYLTEYDIKDIISKQKFIERFKEFFMSVSNDLEKEMYLKKLSQKVDIEVEILRKSLLVENNKKKTFSSRKKIEKKYENRVEEETKKEQEEINKNNRIYKTEFEIIKMILKKPEYYSFFKDKKFDSEITKKIFKYFEEKFNKNLVFNISEIKEILKDFILFTETDIFSDYERENYLVNIIMDTMVVVEVDKNLENKNYLHIFKSYLRERKEARDTSQDSFKIKMSLGKFFVKMEETKTIQEFLELCNKNKEVIDII